MFVIRFQNELNDILKNLDDEDDHILLNADTCEHLAVSGNYDFDDVEEVVAISEILGNNVVISEILGNYVALKIGDLI